MRKGAVGSYLYIRTSTLLIGLLLSPAIAHAADGPTPETAETAGSAAPSKEPTTPVGDIVVTATRRPESLQKVPIAVSVFTSETLRQINPSNIGAVLQLVPGFNFSSESNYRSFATLRGVQGSNEDAAVGMYYDGVYVGQDIAQNLALIDPESVQVLRGPQGALYGKSTLGGAVIVTSRQPLDEFHGNASASYGNYGAKDFRGTVTGPIAKGTLDFLISGYYGDNDGTFRNVFLDKHVNAKRDYGFQGSIKATISDRLSLRLSGDYNHDDRDIGNFKAVYSSLVQPANGLAPGLTNTSSSNTLDSTLIKIYGGNLTAKYDADDFTITSVSAYRGYKSSGFRDADFSGANGQVYLNTQDQSQYSEDISVSSNGSHRFNWIFGSQYYYTSMSVDGITQDNIGNLLFTLPPSAAPVIAPILVPLYKTYSVAAYAQADFKLTDKLKIAAGIRYSNDHREFVKTETVTATGFTAPLVSYTYNQRGTWSAPTPEASISYQVTPGILTYVKYSRSYRPGGFNVNGTFAPLHNAFDAETANAYEAGIKSRFLDGRATLNLTAFQLDWHNQQVSYNGTLGFVTVNANSKSRGVELESSLMPVTGLTLEGNLYYLDAKFGSVLQTVRDPVTRATSNIDVGGSPLSLLAEMVCVGGSDLQYPAVG